MHIPVYFCLLLRTYARFNFLLHWASANGRAMTYLLCIAGWCGHSWNKTAQMCACRIHLCLQKHGFMQVSLSQNKSTRIDIKAVRPVYVGKKGTNRYRGSTFWSGLYGMVPLLPLLLLLLRLQLSGWRQLQKGLFLLQQRQQQQQQYPTSFYRGITSRY